MDLHGFMEWYQLFQRTAIQIRDDKAKPVRQESQLEVCIQEVNSLVYLT